MDLGKIIKALSGWRNSDDGVKSVQPTNPVGADRDPEPPAPKIAYPRATDARVHDSSAAHIPAYSAHMSNASYAVKSNGITASYSFKAAPDLKPHTLSVPSQTARCQICGSNAKILDKVDFNKSCEEARGVMLPLSGILIEYYLCDTCEFCFAPEIQSWNFEEFENRIYNQGYEAVDPDYKFVRPNGNATMLETAFGSSKQRICHLDYGGGSGLLSKTLQQHGWMSETYDPFVDREKNREDLGKFDLITAFEVFEHVPDTTHLLNALKSLCKPDGVILFSTLVSDGNIARSGKLAWWYAAPRNGHISLFSRKSLGLMMSQGGLQFASLNDNLHVAFFKAPDWFIKAIRPDNVEVDKQPDPKATDEVFQSAINWHKQGNLDQAEKLYLELLRIDSRNADALQYLGMLNGQRGQHDTAVEYLQQALAIAPEHFAALNNLGSTLFGLGRFESALEQFDKALKVQPVNDQIWVRRGNVLQGLGRTVDACESFRTAVNINPDLLEIHIILGLALSELGNREEAVSSLRRALEIAPDYAEVHANLANVLADLGRLDDAVESYQRAVEIKPDFSEAHNNLGNVLTRRRQEAEAWPLHESRYHPRKTNSGTKVPVLPFSQWHGQSLVGKSILIWPEQGFGDYIQFVRYTTLLKDLGVSRITLFCVPPLKPLLETVAWVDAVITETASIELHDYWTFPLSLPLHLGTTIDTIPNTLPYLRALPARIERWRERLPEQGVKVGLVWKGNPLHKNDCNRSLPELRTLAPLWSVPGVKFVSLQKWQAEDEAAEFEVDLPLVDLGQEISDFADTAAIVAQLDLVICVDTAIAHLAGALGKPCWVLLPACGTDWRWLLDRSDSPWYPETMRLFRQLKVDDWDETVREVATALQISTDKEFSA